MNVKSLDATRIERVVVRGVNWVGDAVMTIPALRELRLLLPHAHITLATRAWAKGIFAKVDYLDALLIDEPKGGVVRSFLKQQRKWRSERFDLAVIFPNSFQSAFLAFSARIPHRIGFATDKRGRLLSHPLSLPKSLSREHEVYYYLHLIGELERLLTGRRVTARLPSDAISVSPERMAAARAFLQKRGARPSRPFVVLCPGSTNSRAKRWPAERFAALADQLITTIGADVAIIGSSEERNVTDEVAARMHHQALLLTGQTELSLTVAILNLADLLVSNDTGPAHIAAALGRPTLVIFGPTDPVRTRPFSQSGEVIREPPECAPCMLRDCPIDHRCMTAITSSQVFARSARILQERCQHGGDN